MTRNHRDPDRPGRTDTTPLHPRAGEPLGDQLFAALGYGIATTAILLSALRPHTDDLGPLQTILLVALLTLTSLTVIRRRTRTRPARTRTPTRSEHP